MNRRLDAPADRAARPDAAPARGAPIQIYLEGKPVRAHAGESVAVALYASGHRVLSRSLKYHRPRAFFCLEGHCGACLMRIGGVPNLRACMTPCTPDLSIEGQNAYPSPDLDVLEAVDWLFPRGMDHHTLMTGSRVLNAVANKVVRQLSGLGTLPDRPPDAIPAAAALAPDVCVIGAGPAGLAAAEAAARAGARTVVIDEHDRPGGSLLADPRRGPDDADRRARAAADAGADLRLRTAAIAYYAEDDPPILAAAGPGGLLTIRARRYVYATGGYAVNRPFANNDRPGVMAARAVGRMLVQHRIKPADRVCVIGDDDHALALVDALAAAGCEVVRVDGRDRRVDGARGRTWVTGVRVTDADGKRRTVDADLVAVSAPPAPASEGPRQHGCQVVLDPARGGFAVVVNADGHTSAADVLACGDVCGYMGPGPAAEAGARAGAVAAREALAAGGAPGTGDAA